jgi:hypothetical protein
VITTDMCEKRVSNKVTLSMLDQAEECGAVVRLSEDLLYESHEGAACYR